MGKKNFIDKYDICTILYQLTDYSVSTPSPSLCNNRTLSKKLATEHRVAPVFYVMVIPRGFSLHKKSATARQRHHISYAVC